MWSVSFLLMTWWHREPEYWHACYWLSLYVIFYCPHGNHEQHNINNGLCFMWNYEFFEFMQFITSLTHWGHVTHICISNLTIIGSDNGLLPGRRQAIIWTSAWMLSSRPLGTNFSEILIKIHTFSLKKIHLKISSGKCQPFCLGLNVLNSVVTSSVAYRYRKSISIIELFVLIISIYIGFLATNF